MTDRDASRHVGSSQAVIVSGNPTADERANIYAEIDSWTHLFTWQIAFSEFDLGPGRKACITGTDDGRYEVEVIGETP